MSNQRLWCVRVIMRRNMSIKIEYAGRVKYGPMLKRQRTLFQERIELKKRGEDSGDDLLICVEHDPVITLGKHAHRDNVLLSDESLKYQGYDIYEIERGGDVTYHGPGQLVVYPLLDLERYHLGVRDYVNLLEESVIRTVEEYGIIGERVDGASGVWIGKGTADERKICAVGVKISRYLTMHGLALNVSTVLNAFHVINPCGFTDRGVTSIEAETGKAPGLHDVAQSLTGHLISLLEQHKVAHEYRILNFVSG